MKRLTMSKSSKKKAPNEEPLTRHTIEYYFHEEDFKRILLFNSFSDQVEYELSYSCSTPCLFKRWREWNISGDGLIQLEDWYSRE